MNSRMIIVEKFENEPKNGYAARKYMKFWNFFTIQNIKNPNDLRTVILLK